MVSDLKTFAHKGCKIATAKKALADLFHLFTTIKRFFVRTYRSPITKLFRLSEPLGKSNGEKGSQTLKLWLIKVLKLPPIFFVFLKQVLPYYHNFFDISANSHISQEMLCLPYAGFFFKTGVSLLVHKPPQLQEYNYTGLLESEVFFPHCN